MRTPLAVLAALCVVFGVLPGALIGLLAAGGAPAARAAGAALRAFERAVARPAPRRAELV